MAMMGIMTVNAQQKVESDAQAAINNIMTRTSIRAYTNEPVSNADIETMLRAGMAAPTAVNRQPWHFVAVTDKAKLEELAGSRGGMVKQAGVAIVVCGNLNKALQGPAQAFWIQDCSAATENILLAANALGLGAVWTGCYPIDNRVAEVSKVLKLPENMVPFCVIAVGHPAEQPTPKDKWKPENVSFNEFGGKATFDQNEVEVSAAETLSAEQQKANMEEVQAYLKDCGSFAVATADGTQPRVRIFGVSEIIDGKLYIMTGKVKDVYKQIAKNGKFEICALKKSGFEWMRLSGTLVNDETLSVKEEFLNRNEGLKSMYKADDDNMAVLQITNATARFCSFATKERKVGF